MIDPEPEREYHFVRYLGEMVERISFQRFSDGSAIVRGKDGATIYECDPNAWRSAWDKIHRDGFKEV
jgi:hypothetical protein